MNAQKESLKKTSREFEKNIRSQAPDVRAEEKNDGRLKYFLMERRVYKARAENSSHGYQTTSGQRFFIH